jgi:hypothetical protein
MPGGETKIETKEQSEQRVGLRKLRAGRSLNETPTIAPTTKTTNPRQPTTANETENLKNYDNSGAKAG